MGRDVKGTWYCQLVDQVQSDEAAERDGFDERSGERQQPAAKTDFAGARLELHADHRWELDARDPYPSFGTWKLQRGELRLTPAEDCIKWYERIVSSGFSGDKLVIEVELIPDAHDGLDVLVLVFGREAPVERVVPAGYIAQIREADEDAFYALMDELDGEHGAERAREIWDAWAAGELAADPDSPHHEIESWAVREPRAIERGGFTHAHALHALAVVDPVQDDQLAYTIEDGIVRLPEDSVKDAELAAQMSPGWIDRFALSRITGGGISAEFYRRMVVPRAATDEATRRLLLACNDYTRFDQIAELFPGAHADLPAVAIRYCGYQLLLLPLALLEERGLVDATRAALASMLDDPAIKGSRQHQAALWALFLFGRAGLPIPAGAARYLAGKPQGGGGALQPEEKTMVRDAIAGFDQTVQAEAVKRYYL